MEMKKIGIIGGGEIPTAAIALAKEHDVELVRVEDIQKEEFEPTRIPEQVYVIHRPPEILDIPLARAFTAGKGGSKHARSEKQIRKDRKKNKARKTHRRKK